MTAEERLAPDLEARFVAAAAGAVTLYVALTNWGRGQVYLYREIAAMGLVTYVLAFALLLLALVRAPRWTRRVGVVILITVWFTTYASTYVWTHSVHRAYGTDVIAFQHYAAKLVLEGTDPYTVSMRPASEALGVPPHFQTPTLSGGVVDRLSWPAGSFLIFVPFVAAGVADLRWVVLLFHLASLAVLYAAAPRHLRHFVLLPVFAAQELADFTGGGVIDFPWVLPILLMIIWQGRPIAAGICFGAASSIKQAPWLLAPFLLIFYLREAGYGTLRERLGRIGRFGAAAAGVFLAVNGPFIVHDARQWALGTFTPVVGNLIPFGQGLSMLTQLGVPLPVEYYAVVAAAIGALLLANYAVYFERLRDAVWLFPAVIAWVSPRSLHNYFVFWIPTMTLALARQAKDDRAAGLASTDLRIPGVVRRWTAVVSLLLLPLLLLAPAAYLYGRAPGLPLRIEPVAMEDPLAVGAVTRMTVKVTNSGFAEIEPVFSVLASIPYPLGWRMVWGPHRLGPRSMAVYMIEADALEKSIPRDQQVVIRVNHARGSLFATSSAVRAVPEERVPLANAGLTHWILDPATGKKKPFGWEIAGIGGALGRELSVARTVVGGREALAYSITHRGARPGWRGIQVRQSIENPDAVAGLFHDGLNVWVYPTFDFATNSAGWPLNVFGIEINDGTRLLWVVFSDQDPGWYALPNHDIVVVRAPLHQWSHHTINLQALYRKVGRERPQRITFILLAATTHERPGTFAPAFGEISEGTVSRGGGPSK